MQKKCSTLQPGFSFEPPLFQFLKQLAMNNNRAWFQANKKRYEKELLEPSLAFIDHVAQAFAVAKPFMRFLCDAMKIPF